MGNEEAVLASVIETSSGQPLCTFARDQATKDYVLHFKGGSHGLRLVARSHDPRRRNVDLRAFGNAFCQCRARDAGDASYQWFNLLSSLTSQGCAYRGLQLPPRRAHYPTSRCVAVLDARTEQFDGIG